MRLVPGAEKFPIPRREARDRRRGVRLTWVQLFEHTTMKLVIHFSHAKAHAFLAAPYWTWRPLPRHIDHSLVETSNEGRRATYKRCFRKISEERSDAWETDLDEGRMREGKTNTESSPFTSGLYERINWRNFSCRPVFHPF